MEAGPASCPETVAIPSAHVFDPFPPALLAAVAAVPEPAAYGFELLPLLRWLAAHAAPRHAVLLDDGLGLTAPVLPEALPHGTALRHVHDAASVPAGADLVHAASDPDGAVLAGLVAGLAPSGLLLTGPCTLPGGIALAVADGVTLFASGAPPPVFAWLAAQPDADRATLAAAFDRLGRQIASVAALQSRAAETSADGRNEASAVLRAKAATVAAQQERDALREALARAVAERNAIAGSSFWRMTGPMRRTLLSAKTRLRPRPAAADPTPDTPTEKEAFRREAAQALRDFLLSGERLALPASADPDLSILLVLYNQAPLTFLCLQSVVATLPPGASAEVVIVDNASGDDTAVLLDRLDGAVILRNAENRHFLHGMNQAAAAARGRDLLLLNNDARLRPGAIQAAQRTLHMAADIGAVGAKIILPGGPLQEAGSIVWNDGTCVGYGRGHSPTYPAYQFRRDVDFCSGAFLLVRGALFRQLGGLDPAFAPAYYEEVDLCMRLHEAGYRIVYEPAAVIDHFEFGSAAHAEEAFALQRRNHALFTERHAARLAAHHLPPDTPPVLARADRGPRRLLYIDDRVPYPELGAGYPRAARMLRELVADGWAITVYPAHDPDDDWGDTYAAFPREIEFMLGHGKSELAGFLHARDGAFDTILVSRPHNMTAFLAARGDTHRTARLIYDAEAMFATREFLRMEQAGRPATIEHRRALLEQEMALTATAATVTSVNEREAGIFRGGGHRDVRVLGLGVEPAPVPAGFSGRSGFLFVGTVDEDTSPNVDALVFFVGSVMPLLSARLGHPAQLTVAGRCRSPRVQALAGDTVRLMGIVGDLTPLYASARVFVAPHRFAAGLPLKVQEAASRGLPVVASPLLAQQLGWSDGVELLVASEADAFAAACARLHEDPALWHRLRRGGLARLAAEASTDEFGATLRAIMAG